MSRCVDDISSISHAQIPLVDPSGASFRLIISHEVSYSKQNISTPASTSQPRSSSLNFSNIFVLITHTKYIKLHVEKKTVLKSARSFYLHYNRDGLQARWLQTGEMREEGTAKCE